MVGLESRLKEVLSHLRFEPYRVLIVGIHGATGIGKTTLAREIYNMIADHFDVMIMLFMNCHYCTSIYIHSTTLMITN